MPAPRPATLAAIPLLVLATAALTPQEAGPPILGFTEAGAREQRALEARFDAVLDPSNLDGWMERFTSEPLYTGSAKDRDNAEYVAELLRSWGYDTAIEEYRVLFPMPLVREVELVSPGSYRARLEEPVIEEDGTSGVGGRLPTYNAYSADGDVTGELVYVNYGIPDDYEELERRGISVEGRIVIARYGGSWRGIKPKVAAEHGALACLIYSDPADDGYGPGDVYPEGSYRPEHGVQRGSVMDMPLYPGDPLTPGTGATADADRLEVADAPTVMKIPVLPLSYGDARPLLEALEGPVAPSAWRGGLPLTYHMGPGPARVRVHVEFDWSLKPALDVIARLPGSELPDEWVVRGNHRDGWAMGAGDPISGQVAMLEEARAIGELVRSGWRPKRTIVFASWDAEEPGLIGSTEWAEHHAVELREKAVAYINTDGNGRGFLGMSGSHTLERFINQVARDVPDPQTEVSVQERSRARAAVAGSQEAASRADLRISPLGSGSDYTPFLQHLGIASLSLGFGGENGGGQYHSQYDSYDYYTRFGDPGFQYGVTLAKVTGRTTLRLANADVIPLHFGGLADNVSRYLDEVSALADRMRQETERRNELIAKGWFEVSADPTSTYVAPEPDDEVPFLALAPLQNAVRHLKESAEAYDAALEKRSAEGSLADLAPRLDPILMSTERLMTREGGLPRRPWFRHQIYAPGFYTGYGVKTLPGVREAIEERSWDEATEQIGHAAAAIEAVATAIEEGTTLLGG